MKQDRFPEIAPPDYEIELSRGGRILSWIGCALCFVAAALFATFLVIQVVLMTLDAI